MAKTSVIMGVYNAQRESSFQRSINSILGQTCRDFKFIICDDGSTDNTYQLLQAYQSQDERIILLRNDENQGLAYTLNKCIQHAGGDILVRQDIDDYSDLTRIERLLAAFEQYPKVSIIGSNISLYDDKGTWGQTQFPEFPKRDDFLFGVPFRHGAVAMKKSAVLQVGGYTVSKRTRRTEDYDLFMRLYAANFTGYNVQKELYAYKEDCAAVAKRLYRYRVDEVAVRWHGFKKLGLMPKGVPYAIKPLAVGLLPKQLLNRLKNSYYKRLK